MSIKLGVFVTGTDTGVGKTVASSLLLASLRTFGIRAGYFKPVQTGAELDTATVAQLTGYPEAKLPKPVYQLEGETAPYRAALSQGIEIQLDEILKAWNQLDDRAWVIEGAGGLMVPLNAKLTIRDLIAALGLRMVIVAPTRLGTINHTLMTVEMARTAGISMAGIVLVGKEDPGLKEVLEQFTKVPVLTRIPVLDPLTPSLVQDFSVNYFSAEVLRQIYE